MITDCSPMRRHHFYRCRMVIFIGEWHGWSLMSVTGMCALITCLMWSISFVTSQARHTGSMRGASSPLSRQLSLRGFASRGETSKTSSLKNQKSLHVRDYPPPFDLLSSHESWKFDPMWPREDAVSWQVPAAQLPTPPWDGGNWISESGRPYECCCIWWNFLRVT